MTYKEFVKWCNNRASDGCWGPGTAMLCIQYIEAMKNYKKENGRKKVEPMWQELWNEDGSTIRKHVEHCDAKRKEAAVNE